jgi:tRNA threonylcarbamoyl adenosine modification protein YjeE
VAELTVAVRSEVEMRSLGRSLGALLEPGDTVLLDGVIGAGKSVLVREVVRSRGVEGHVPSPTFALAFSYPVDSMVIVHADAYRLEDPQEYVDLAIEESYDDPAVLIEWGSRVAEVVPDDHLQVLIEAGDDEEARTVHFSSTGDAWQRRIPALAFQ